MFNSHNLSLKLIQRCPACNAAFQQAQISIVQETDFTLLAHMQCQQCRVNLLANVVNMPQGLVGNAILTDIQLEEVGKLLDFEAMEDNYFLNVYNFVRQKDLWHQLHSQPRPADNQSNTLSKNN